MLVINDDDDDEDDDDDDNDDEDDDEDKDNDNIDASTMMLITDHDATRRPPPVWLSALEWPPSRGASSSSGVIAKTSTGWQPKRRIGKRLMMMMMLMAMIIRVVNEKTTRPWHSI